jgi:hypothetical protein
VGPVTLRKWLARGPAVDDFSASPDIRVPCQGRGGPAGGDRWRGAAAPGGDEQRRGGAGPVVVSGDAERRRRRGSGAGATDSIWSGDFWELTIGSCQ